MRTSVKMLGGRGARMWAPGSGNWVPVRDGGVPATFFTSVGLVSSADGSSRMGKKQMTPMCQVLSDTASSSPLALPSTSSAVQKFSSEEAFG